MPQLPDPNALNRVAAQPNRTVATYRPGQVGQALEQLGGAVANQGNNLQYVAARQQDHLDKVKVQDALNQLEMHQQEFTVGEKGYKRVMNGDVLKPDYHKSYVSQFDTAVSGLAGGLTPQQRQLFEQSAKQQQVQFRAGMMQHAIGQASQFEDQVYKDTIATTQNAAATNWADPKAVEAQLVKANLATADRLTRMGMTDPTTRALQAKEVEGGVHSAVVLAALNADNAGYAKSYFDQNKEYMTPQQIKAVEGQIKPATDFARGRDLGTEAFKMLQSGKSAVDVEAYLVSKADTPGIHQQAQSIYGQLTQAVKVQDANAKGSIIEKFSTGGASVGTMNKLMNSADYRALSPAQRGDVAEYMRKTSKEGANGPEAISMQSYARYLDVSNSPELSAMSRQQIFALEPQLGKTLTRHILAKQSEQQNNIPSFQIDADMFNAAIPASAQGDTQKTRAYKGVVESKLREFLEVEKRKPTLDEQKALLRTGSEVYVEAGRFFGANEREAYERNPERKAVPAAFHSQVKGIFGNDMAKMEDAYGFVTGMKHIARLKKRTIPTDAEAIQAYLQLQNGESELSKQIPR